MSQVVAYLLIRVGGRGGHVFRPVLVLLVERVDVWLVYCLATGNY